jgi:hypothetical protein
MGFEVVRGRVGPRFSVLNDWQQVMPLATSLEAIFTSVLTGRFITLGNGRKSKERLFSIFLYPASESASIVEIMKNSMLVTSMPHW